MHRQSKEPRNRLWIQGLEFYHEVEGLSIFFWQPQTFWLILATASRSVTCNRELRFSTWAAPLFFVLLMVLFQIPYLKFWPFQLKQYKTEEYLGRFWEWNAERNNQFEVVEIMGIEPTTSALRTQRSPSWAISPPAWKLTGRMMH